MKYTPGNPDWQRRYDSTVQRLLPPAQRLARRIRQANTPVSRFIKRLFFTSK